MLIALSISQLIHDPFFVRRFSTEKGMSTRVQEETVSGYSAGHNIWVIECNHVETSNSSSVLNFKPQLVEIYTTIVVEYEYIYPVGSLYGMKERRRNEHETVECVFSFVRGENAHVKLEYSSSLHFRIEWECESGLGGKRFKRCNFLSITIEMWLSRQTKPFFEPFHYSEISYSHLEKCYIINIGHSRKCRKKAECWIGEKMNNHKFTWICSNFCELTFELQWKRK